MQYNIGNYKVRAKDVKNKKSWRTFKLGLLVGAVVCVAAYTGEIWLPKEIVAMQNKNDSFVMPVAMVAEADTIENAVKDRSLDDLWNEALDNLSYGCEVKNVAPEKQEGQITFDSNAKASIGLFQFQQETVVLYTKALYGKDIDYAEANRIASTKDLARSLAKDIAKKEGIVSDWYNCSQREFTINGSDKKIALGDFIEVLRALEN